uniref:Uncharacterized protein n=1 Tax=Timema cristinae TaxID=61476 RepID=A0A7R9D0R0_TIMCR|nr:unnamed protein product [Timema cristinae]
MTQVCPKIEVDYVSAILDFLRDSSNISSATMKLSVPGHSSIQEVDNADSIIEKDINHTDFYSPPGPIRILMQMNRRNSYRVSFAGEYCH